MGIDLDPEMLELYINLSSMASSNQSIDGQGLLSYKYRWLELLLSAAILILQLTWATISKVDPHCNLYGIADASIWYSGDLGNKTFYNPP